MSVSIGGGGRAPGLRPLRAAIAFLWLATGLGVLHPHYREVGAAWLSRVGLPEWPMFATCAFEVALGLRVLARPVGTALALFQVGMVVSFTVILATAEPMMLVHPFGMLSKNLPFVALVGVVALVEREGWTARATWLLRAGMAVVWITEGLLPKVLFQQPVELAVVARSGLVSMDPATFLAGLGALQAASGVLALVARGRLLSATLLAQSAALIVLPGLVGTQDPLLWFHPFGPLTKNVPILAGTLVAWHRCSRSS